jgi:hypothetical protein
LKSWRSQGQWHPDAGRVRRQKRPSCSRSSSRRRPAFGHRQRLPVTALCPAAARRSIPARSPPIAVCLLPDNRGAQWRRSYIAPAIELFDDSSPLQLSVGSAVVGCRGGRSRWSAAAIPIWRPSDRTGLPDDLAAQYNSSRRQRRLCVQFFRLARPAIRRGPSVWDGASTAISGKHLPWPATSGCRCSAQGELAALKLALGCWLWSSWRRDL